MSFPLFRGLEETHKWGDHVSVEYTFSYNSCFLSSGPPGPLLKHHGGAAPPRPIHPQPTGQVCRSYLPPPLQLPLFHTRHAEESAERPHLMTIVRPCSQSMLRKVTCC